MGRRLLIGFLLPQVPGGGTLIRRAAFMLQALETKKPQTAHMAGRSGM